MKLLILFFLAFMNCGFCAYTDPEIECLLQSLSNPFNPSLEDYRMIESYFQNGDRPYLNKMTRRSDVDYRIQQLRNWKLVGPNGEMPVLELYASHVTEATKDRCILICASYNTNYPARALQLFEQLKSCGYSGYIMLRIGGIPDISHGGARLATIPYTWRVNFFKEAVRRGFTKILYLDPMLPPSSDLSGIFEVIDNNGLFSYGIILDWTGPYHDYGQHLGILREQMHHITWFDGHVIGLNFTHEKVQHLFQKWDEEMHTIEGFSTIGDDVPFAFLAWKLGFQPIKAIPGEQQQLKLSDQFFQDSP